LGDISGEIEEKMGEKEEKKKKKGKRMKREMNTHDLSPNLVAMR